MKALFLLFGIVLFAGTCCKPADGGEKKSNVTDVIKDASTEVDDYDEETADYEDVYSDTDDYQRSLSGNRTNLRKKKINVHLGTLHPMKKLKEKIQKEKEARTVKLILKIVGGVILLIVLLGIYVCARRMCKKKRQTVVSNPEEAVPALFPISNMTQPQPYPQQPVVYPLLQVPNQPTAYSYTPIQQNPPYPTAPYPTAPALNPPPYVQEKSSNNF